MVFGDKSGLDDTSRDLLNRCGIAHIAVVSGLHLVFFCGVLLWIFRRLSLPARLSFLLMLPAIVLFIMLADASVSVYRAAVMVLLSSGARLFGRRSDTLRSLCLAMFLCTAAAPYVIGSASFWLTVSGVFGIGILAPYMTAGLRCGKTLRTFLSLCCVSLAVFPASVLLCGESSLLGPVTNLLILPLCVFALYLGFSMLLTGGLTAFLLPIAGMLCRAVRTAAGILAGLPFSHITVTEQPVRLALAMLTALILLMLVFRPKPQETAAAVLSAAVLLSAVAVCSKIQCDSQLRIAVLGGRKQAALVITADGAAVIADLTGAPRNAQYVQRYLEQSGIVRADVLILSGGKAAAGYQSALSGTEVGAVMLCNADGWRETMTLCGKQPYFGTDELQIKCGTLEIALSGDLLTVSRNGLRVTALPVQSEAEPQTEAVIRYGGALHTVTFPAIPRTLEAQDLLIRITGDGKGDAVELDEIPDKP
jgi:ComEC/Rec2-related protein